MEGILEGNKNGYINEMKDLLVTEGIHIYLQVQVYEDMYASNVAFRNVWCQCVVVVCVVWCSGQCAAHLQQERSPSLHSSTPIEDRRRGEGREGMSTGLQPKSQYSLS